MTDHDTEAVTAVALVLADIEGDSETYRILAEDVVQAARPHLAAAERARLADRQQMVDEVKAELDDAFQFTNPDGSRHSYVTREWVQVLIATQAASAAAAECERIADLADAEAERLTAEWGGPPLPRTERAATVLREFGAKIRQHAAAGEDTPDATVALRLLLALGGREGAREALRDALAWCHELEGPGQPHPRVSRWEAAIHVLNEQAPEGDTSDI